MGNRRTGKAIYLDYAASTPVRPEVLAAMRPYFADDFGNPNSLHSFGGRALAAVDRAREDIAKGIAAEFREIIFTGSATEANNLALRGIVRLARNFGILNPHVIISQIEHESVLETARDLAATEKIEISFLPVSRLGLVSPADLRSQIRPSTALISVMHGSNEIGTIEPIAELAKIIQDYRNDRESFLPLFHTDAAQTFQFLPCHVDELGVDLMTFSAHKIYGPKGIGALYVRMADGKWRMANRNMPGAANYLPPLITGGGQEFGLRSGTENVPLIAGFREAVWLAGRERARLSRRLHALRFHLWKSLKKICAEAAINGVPCGRREETYSPLTLPHIINVYIPEREAQFLITKLDLCGVAVSSGSACRARARAASYVIQALGYTKERAKRSVRFSLGKMTKRGDIDKVIGILSKILKNKKWQKTKANS